MSNVRLIFGASPKSELTTEIECLANAQDEIFIGIKDKNSPHKEEFIVLDIPTAIKFSKELRKQIGIIKGQEVENG